MSKKRSNQKKSPLSCPICGKGGFYASGPLEAHKKAIHPDTLEADKNTYQLVYNVQKTETTGFQQATCPACKQPTLIYVKDDGTIASSSEMPKPPSSSNQPKKSQIKRGAHPIFIRERYKMRWNAAVGRWKNTVCLSGTHGRTGPEIPWHEKGIDEFWMLNDCHGVVYIQPYIEKVSRWFQIHHRWRITRRTSRQSVDRVVQDHWEWLKQTIVPRVVMHRKFREIPNSEGFPFREVCEMFLKDRLGRGAGYTQYYFTNTFSYMLAQIAYEKVKGIKDWERIEIYGCELEQIESEFVRQRPGIEFWFGMLVAMGVEIYVPESCFMLYPQIIETVSPAGQKLVNADGYTAYGYKSPSLAEAQASGQPVGVDPIEENVIGSWDDYDYIDHTYIYRDEMTKRVQRHDLSIFVKENEVLNKWLDVLPAA